MAEFTREIDVATSPKKSKIAETVEKTVIAVIITVIFSLFFIGLFLYAVTAPYGKTQKQVSPEFWEVKCHYGEVFKSDPEDIQLYRNEDGSYWAVAPRGLQRAGEAVRITDKNEQRVIDCEIG